ncbi:hypothetical protein SteCoe_37455 [Stentor coeruleus]|uniref:Cyclic nucleotide-binding domain-containing protein n=1 Tax=Stentor coeruleus TaxID=5963 RepID=A0A1R2AN28_9CILI|nr:hypothetical protein SteCoe_37455 [Stentor coeruleus]
MPTRSLRRSDTTTQDLLNGLRRMSTIRDLTENQTFSENEDKFNQEIRKLTRKKTEIDLKFLANYGEIEEFKHINTLKEGDFFGELALINNKPRTATVEAAEVCYLAVVSKKDFKKILCTDAVKSLEERVTFLKSLPAFTDVSKLSLQKFVYNFSEATYKKDQKIFDEADLAESIYFVKSGEIKICQRDILETPKYGATPDIFLRLSMMKIQKKRVNLREVIKGKNEIIGYEEIIESKEKRLRVCTCLSNFAIVYEVKIDTLKRFPFYSEVMTFLENKYKSDYIRAAHLTLPMKEIEKFKQSSSPKVNIPKNVQNILYTMRNKEDQLNSQGKGSTRIASSLGLVESPSKLLKSLSKGLIMSNSPYKKKRALQKIDPLPIDYTKKIEANGYLKDVLKSVNKKSVIENLTSRYEASYIDSPRSPRSSERYDIKCLVLNDFIF